MTIDDKPVTKGDKIVLKIARANGYAWKQAEVVEVHSTLPMIKLLTFSGREEKARGYVKWEKLEDCFWAKPEEVKA